MPHSSCGTEGCYARLPAAGGHAALKMPTRIYLSPPHLFGDERALVTEAFDSNWIAPLGPHVDAFEREIAARVGVQSAAALCSGTSALHLALILLGVDAGDDVICSSLTFVGSTNPILYQRARPVLVDSERTSWNMDPELLEAALRDASARGKLPKAAIIVDLYGQCADYDALLPICARYGVPVIEDAAEALGATHGTRAAGSFGAFSILSFNGNKIITSSGGGMLLGNDTAAIARARFLATQARDPAPHYEHSTIGFNYRLSNVCAAIGRGQLAGLDIRVAARRRNFSAYVERLGSVPGIGFMPEAPWGTCTRWLTCIEIDPSRFGATREDVRLALEAAGIEARPLWKPMHMQPVFADVPRYERGVGEALFRDGLCLPSGSSLTPAEIDEICGIIVGVGAKR